MRLKVDKIIDGTQGYENRENAQKAEVLGGRANGLALCQSVGS